MDIYLGANYLHYLFMFSVALAQLVNNSSPKLEVKVATKKSKKETKPKKELSETAGAEKGMIIIFKYHIIFFCTWSKIATQQQHTFTHDTVLTPFTYKSTSIPFSPFFSRSAITSLYLELRKNNKIYLYTYTYCYLFSVVSSKGKRKIAAVSMAKKKSISKTPAVSKIPAKRKKKGDPATSEGS